MLKKLLTILVILIVTLPWFMGAVDLYCYFLFGKVTGIFLWDEVKIVFAASFPGFALLVCLGVFIVLENMGYL